MTIGGGFEGAAFDSDYQAVLNYATTQGYTLPSTGQQTLQNQLVVDLKAGGIWSKLDTLRVYATDGSSNFALIDWKRLTDCTAINSPTFITNQGYMGNGTSSYIDTNFNPNTAIAANNYKTDDASIGAWVFTAGGNGLCGANNASNVSIRNVNSGQHRVNSGNIVTSANLSGTGLKGGNRTSSLNIVMVSNLTLTSVAVSAGANVNDTITDFKAVGSLFFSGTSSIAYAGASLVAEHTDLYNAFDTYMTSL